jgi:vacuolar-type H+-ATPase subunit H
MRPTPPSALSLLLEAERRCSERLAAAEADAAATLAAADEHQRELDRQAAAELDTELAALERELRSTLDAELARVAAEAAARVQACETWPDAERTRVAESWLASALRVLP